MTASAKSFLRRGHRALGKGNAEAALAAFGAAIEASPDDRRGYIQAALAQLRAGNEEAARAAVETITRRFPSDPVVHLLAGRVLLECGDAEGAEPLLRQAVEAQPENELARQYLALCDLMKGDVASAAVEMERLGFAGNASFLALFSFEVERRLAPVASVGDAEAPPPEPAVAAEIGQLENRAQGIAPSFLGRSRRRRILGKMLNRGERAYDRGELADALAWFEAACRLDADSVTALLGVGVSALHLGRPNQAEEFLARAHALSPNDGMIASSYGDALYRSGRAAEALAVFEQIAPAGPEDFHANYGCGMCLTALVRRTESLEKFRTAFERFRLDSLDDCLMPAWEEMKRTQNGERRTK